ncbi:uncharacterized protein SCDLUD_001431 [Saccharomycodes ludwigii]|uniref:uncharacterized protein n=1 Tax=Saccharomycodes ludwigii TaxID=36035 RepID=UPI001E8A1404|nr:hypothetical protein SCDLUD_001431 [Saccharomycodes ludwigii]KAH3901662.1 hypothetical protein SCDLUD_001431 [Saccharomycodes ludwigii]
MQFNTSIKLIRSLNTSSKCMITSTPKKAATTIDTSTASAATSNASNNASKRQSKNIETNSKDKIKRYTTSGITKVSSDNEHVNVVGDHLRV